MHACAHVYTYMNEPVLYCIVLYLCPGVYPLIHIQRNKDGNKKDRIETKKYITGIFRKKKNKKKKNNITKNVKGHYQILRMGKTIVKINMEGIDQIHH